MKMSFIAFVAVAIALVAYQIKKSEAASVAVHDDNLPQIEQQLEPLSELQVAEVPQVQQQVGEKAAPDLAPVQKPELVQDSVNSVEAAPLRSSIEVAPKKEKSKFSGSLIITGTTDSKEMDDEDKSFESSFEGSLNYRFASKHAVGIYAGMDKKLTQERSENIYNTKLRLISSSLYQAGIFNFSMINSIILPTNEVSQRRDDLQAGLELSPSFRFAPKDYLAFTYNPRFLRNFHKYETNRVNQVLVEYQLSQYFIVDYSFNDKWSLQPALVYVDAVSYLGSERHDKFLTQLELGYALSDNAALALGISNTGQVINHQMGSDETIQFYDRESATFYGAMALAF